MLYIIRLQYMVNQCVRPYPDQWEPAVTEEGVPGGGLFDDLVTQRLLLLLCQHKQTAEVPLIFMGINFCGFNKHHSFKHKSINNDLINTSIQYVIKNCTSMNIQFHQLNNKIHEYLYSMNTAETTVDKYMYVHILVS